MNEYGDFLLTLGWLLAVFGILAGIYGGYRRSTAWARTAAHATILVCACVGLALFVLAYGFYTSDFSNQYIWQFSNRDMPAVYRISAIWGGMDGSMLLWCFMLTISSAVVASRIGTYPAKLMPWVLAVANSSILFFLTVVVFLTNPFRFIKAGFIPPDGNGLNPLLQNPLMAIHPPMLYAGFTTFAIPYAFCLGALLSGSVGNEWIRLTRRWTLIAWSFLTAGIVLGGHWAYVVLGWGGFWAWDPVENASFLPWLTGTAFLHSVMVQERKNMLKFWNIWLIVLTYSLTVFGTFLTRSGVVQSVHAFASTDIGWVFLLYLAIILTLSLALSIFRREELKSERKIESFLSREAFFLFNNLVFLSICFAVLWGVMFPVLSEAVTGVKQTVSIPFFNAVNVPLFMLLIFLMGVGPLIAWRKATWKSLARTFVVPVTFGFLAGMLLIWAGVEGFYPVLSYSLCTFVVMTVVGELHRGYRAQRESTPTLGPIDSMSSLVRRHSSRYGGHLVHIGVVIVTIGITASMASKVEKEFTLTKGQTYDIGRFSLRLEDVQETRTSNYSGVYALTSVLNRANGEKIGELKPEMRRFFKNDESTNEVALRVSLREDLYLIVAGIVDDGNRVTMKVFINPLQVWLWIGAIIMVLGGFVVMIPRYSASAARAEVPARSAGSLSQN